MWLYSALNHSLCTFMQYLVNFANRTWLIYLVHLDVFLWTCIHVASAREDLLLLCMWKISSNSIILVVPAVHPIPWHFWSHLMKATWWIQAETERQSERAKVRNCSARLPVSFSHCDETNRSKKRMGHRQKKKRSHYYLTRCNRFSFHFSLSILSLVHLFLVNSSALSSVSIKLRSTLTWFSFKMTISHKKVMWGSLVRQGRNTKILGITAHATPARYEGEIMSSKKGTRKVLFVHFITVLCVSYWLTPSLLYLCEVKPVVGASLSFMLLFLTLVRK